MLRRILRLLNLSLPICLMIGLASGAICFGEKPRCKLLLTNRGATLQREMTSAAADGFRVKFAARTEGLQLAVYMEREDGDAESIQYLYIGAQLAGSLEKELNDAALNGFRLVPRAIFSGESNDFGLILEKRASGPTDYRLLSTNLTGTLSREIAEATALGFRAVALVNRRGHAAILEKTEKTGSSAPKCRVVATTLTSTLQSELSDAARDGFRIVGAAPSQKSEVVVLLEASASAPSNYKVVATARLATLQSELNRWGRQGYRVEPGGVTVKRIPGSGEKQVTVFGGGGRDSTSHGFVGEEIVVAMAQHSERFEYEVLDALRPSKLEEKIAESVEAGFRMVAATSGASKDRLIIGTLAVIGERPLP